MAEKKNHLGKAGQLAAMAEFLLRGYNVAIPEVDVGDDIFVVDDDLGSIDRIQVKTAEPHIDKSRRVFVQFQLSRRQLEIVRPRELTYVFALRRQEQWDFFVLARPALLSLRHAYEAAEGKKRRKSTGKTIKLELALTAHDSIGFDVSFQPYRNNWSAFPKLTQGPGATARATSAARSRKKKPPSP